MFMYEYLFFHCQEFIEKIWKIWTEMLERIFASLAQSLKRSLDILVGHHKFSGCFCVAESLCNVTSELFSHWASRAPVTEIEEKTRKVKQSLAQRLVNIVTAINIVAQKYTLSFPCSFLLWIVVNPQLIKHKNWIQELLTTWLIVYEPTNYCNNTK